jgi:hypothetical protein
VADALSRPELEVAAVLLPDLDLAHLAEDQPDLVDLQTDCPGLTIQRLDRAGRIMLCDVSTGKPRPILVGQWPKKIFSTLHNLSHAGTKPTLRAISDRFVWKNMCRDVRR